MPSSHLILCRPLLLLPPIPPSIRVFSNESTLHMRWPKYWSFSFSIIPSTEIPGLISFRRDWLDLLVPTSDPPKPSLYSSPDLPSLLTRRGDSTATELVGFKCKHPRNLPMQQSAGPGRAQEGLPERSRLAAGAPAGHQRWP